RAADGQSGRAAGDIGAGGDVERESGRRAAVGVADAAVGLRDARARGDAIDGDVGGASAGVGEQVAQVVADVPARLPDDVVVTQDQGDPALEAGVVVVVVVSAHAAQVPGLDGSLIDDERVVELVVLGDHAQGSQAGLVERPARVAAAGGSDRRIGRSGLAGAVQHAEL